MPFDGQGFMHGQPERRFYPAPRQISFKSELLIVVEAVLVSVSILAICMLGFFLVNGFPFHEQYEATYPMTGLLVGWILSIISFRVWCWKMDYNFDAHE